MIHFFLACEDPLSESFCLQLMKNYFPNATYNPIIVTGGVGELKKKVQAFINIAKIQDKATLILTDLDQLDNVETLVADWQGAAIFPDTFFLFIAVKEIESWVLADFEAFSQWSGIPRNKIPNNPDDENDIKQKLLNLVKKYANIQTKRDLLPSKDAKTSKVGIAYNSSLIYFVNNYWSIDRAKLNSMSLNNVDLILTRYANSI